MKIAVAGGTGTVGRFVVETAQRRGHHTVVLTRSNGIELTSGRGLGQALAGVDAVIDVSNRDSLTKRKATEFFTAVTANLQRAEQAAGVGHHLALSIVGIDGAPLGYYQGKLAQERQLRSGAVPFTILRATQFHEFADQSLRRKIGHLALVPHMKSQPVAARAVAAELVRLAEEPAAGATVEMAGPQILDIVDMCKALVRHRGDRLRVVPVFLPGKAGMVGRTGGLLPNGSFEMDRQTFAEWLADQPVLSSRAGGPASEPGAVNS